MTTEEIRNIVRATIREELNFLVPPDLPIHRLLAERRKDLGYTQEAVAKRLFVSPASVAQWEGGSLPMKHAPAYARLLGMRLLLVPDGEQLDLFSGGGHV